MSRYISSIEDPSSNTSKIRINNLYTMLCCADYTQFHSNNNRISRVGGFILYTCIYIYIYIYTRSLNESEYRSGIAALETRITKSEIQYRGCVFPLFSIRLCFPLSFSLLLSLFNFVYFIYFFSPFLLYTYINSTGSKLIFMQIRAFKARGFFVHWFTPVYTRLKHGYVDFSPRNPRGNHAARYPHTYR